MKKKNVHLPIYQIIFHCSSCNQEYQTTSASSQKRQSRESCRNCNPFYTGASASEIKVGAVEKFRQRQKVKEKI